MDGINWSLFGGVGHVEFVSAPEKDACVADDGRQVALVDPGATLPPYASTAFLQLLADPTLPLEMLVRMARMAVRYDDTAGRERIISYIFMRIRAFNERWAGRLLASLSVLPDEQYAMVNDLCADLHECVLRAILDPERRFWEENFLHCLYFERKHVYRSFMTREGWWQQPGRRVPRMLLDSLDRLTRSEDDRSSVTDLEDKHAQALLLTVERSEILHVVLLLPEKLKAVLLLIFWEERSEKEVARILGISDRAVRYRLRDALQRLRALLMKAEGGSSYV